MNKNVLFKILPQKNNILKAVLVMSALFYLFLFLFIALKRLAYPFELEFMEGGSLMQVMRLLRSEPLYVEPSLEYVPLLYPPLYFYSAAWITEFFSFGFLPLRLISLISTLGSMVCIYLLIRKYATPFYAVVSVGLYAACFYICGAWYDIARVDALFLFLLLAGIVFLQRQTPCAVILAGLFFLLAFMTKQIAAAIFLGSVLALALSNAPRYLKILYPLPFIVLVIPYIAGMQNLSDHWFLFYLFVLPGQHDVLPAMLLKFWQHDILSSLFILFVFSLLFFLFLYKRDKKEFCFHFFIAASMIMASWVSRLHAGGYINVLLPAMAVFSVYSVLGLAQLMTYLDLPGNEQLTLSGQKPHLSFSAGFAKSIMLLLFLLQFMMLLYDPRDQIPSRNDLRAGYQLIEEMKTIPGDIFMPWHGYLPVLAGKPAFATHGLYDILRSQNDSIRIRLQNQLDTAFARRRFETVILDDRWYDPIFLDHYQFERFVFSAPGVFYPVTGMRLRPEFIYTKVESIYTH
ncbi:hypothetical protein GF407_09655 [candidate division KSB1 bacterium]|nr:hypothetical protein [candidate division KSB1 bacterium]